MSTSFVRSCLTLVALLATLHATGMALGSDLEPRELPTQLINTPDAEDRNGACSKCRVSSLAAAQSAAQDGATLEIYFDDERDGLHGYVELTILLTNGSYHVETIENVDLVNRRIASFVLGPRSAWSWRDDVEHLWVEVVATVAVQP